MGRRGPKPQTAAVAAVKAPVRSKRKPAASAPTTDSATSSGPKPPAWLKGQALEIWSRLAPTLTAAKLLGAADENAFGRYCRNLAVWLELRDELDHDGFTYEAESYAAGKGEGDGKTTLLRRLDPRFMVTDRLERQLLAAEDRFGMNPSERQRIMAARLNSGVSGDLFDQARKIDDDPAVRASAPAAPQPASSPVGLLN